ncbi:unnamed protein product [Prorocentrum cordatum]|uniref:PARP catalytic domain-containing protein n=1 Tax=Prorocentrum cordatum TaxID=2364126 RepID=A0ABN9UUB0_9DINO|nr:unnamed protein product [Polarella glacialis]
MAPGCAGGCSQAASPRSSCSATRPSSGEEGSHRGAPADVRGPCRPRAFVEAVGAAAAPDASSAPLDATSEEGVAARDFCAGHPCRRREARRSPEEGLSQGARAPAARRFRRPPRVTASRLRGVAAGGPRLGHGGPREGARRFQGPSFQSIREYVGQRFSAELHHAFGPGARVSDAGVSAAVERQFLQRLRRSGRLEDSLRLAFHGSRKANFASILRRGFLLPGWGRHRVPVAHGNAHGPGIYTAREGAAQLSRGFCDSASMLVCAVIDDAGVVEDGRDSEARAARTALRIGRPPRSPSVCVRLRSNGAPVKGAGVPQPAGGMFWRPALLGGREVHRRTSEITHVGDAMVVFNPSCVAPLFRVDHVPERLYQPRWRKSAAAPCAEAAAAEPAEPVDDLIPPDGNPNLGSPPEDTSQARATRHEVAMKRNMLRRQRQRTVRRARDLKWGGR